MSHVYIYESILVTNKQSHKRNQSSDRPGVKIFSRKTENSKNKFHIYNKNGCVNTIKWNFQ